MGPGECRGLEGVWKASAQPPTTKWLWVLRSLGSLPGTFLLLAWEGLHRPQTDPICNLGVLLDSQLLLKKQMVEEPFLWNIHTLVNPPTGLHLMQCTLHGAACEDYSDTSEGEKDQT